MGLKLQRSCNILTTWLKNKHDAGALIFSAQDSWIDFNDRLLKLAACTGFDQVQGSMDGVLEQNYRERVKSTMMRQEEIFKEQVHELHRLYRVQRMLTAELKTKEARIHQQAIATATIAVADMKSRYWNSTSTSETSHSSHISNLHHTAPQSKSEYSSLHQHGMLAGEPSMKDKAYGLQQLADEECDVELSLSIGCSSSKKKKRPKNWLRPEATTSGARHRLLPNTEARPERQRMQRGGELTETSVAIPGYEFEQNIGFDSLHESFRLWR